MNKHTSRTRGQEGFTLVYMAAILALLMVSTGLAVDSGRAYLVKAQLSKAVDGAALAAARAFNNGNPQAVAAQIFKANFPAGYLGTAAAPDPTAAANFFASSTNAATGINVVTITASAVMPTTFMSVANLNTVTVASSGQATRRMVDLSLILDVSSSIGTRWPAVRDAARSFIDAFDQNNDRLSLLTFSNGAAVLDPMPAGRGFNKAQLEADVPQNLPGGSTLMVEGIYRGWDELRSVANGTQSGLRIIVLFTDGASNGVPGTYDGSGLAKSLRSWDFPKQAVDPDSQTWDSPHIDGLYATDTGNSNPSYTLTVPWNSPLTIAAVPYLPVQTLHTHHRSAGIPTAFPLQTAALTVNGAAQNAARPLRDFDAAAGKYPAEVFNINNAARNVLEIIADAARQDAGGDYKIRIYTIGMGYLIRDLLGTMPEKPEDILKRVANDATSPDFNGGQLEGKYFFAQTGADVAPAFQGIQNLILRLSK
ncbi:MAG TPA: vWA domain-containing protein [Vicinamibacterales bacterium]|jgi:Flp pilus assembly protein TadG|nr:vWA domain-containing protein [Vicinamibacterales bacterium]